MITVLENTEVDCRDRKIDSWLNRWLNKNETCLINFEKTQEELQIRKFVRQDYNLSPLLFNLRIHRRILAK